MYSPGMFLFVVATAVVVKIFLVNAIVGWRRWRGKFRYSPGASFFVTTVHVVVVVGGVTTTYIIGGGCVD